MDDVAEFLPIKLSPGFISVAFHLGCIGCNFCSVRFGNRRDRLFRDRVHNTYPTTPKDIARLLSGMPSFSDALIPLRIGNDTDYKFEIRQTQELCSLLPTDYPVVVLTRFPLTRLDEQTFQKSNVLLKITATPRSTYLDCPQNAHEVVESIGVTSGPVVLTIGPITQDNYADSVELISRIPQKQNIYVYIKELNDEFSPSLAIIPKCSKAQLDELRQQVESRGFRHLSNLRCPLNERSSIAHVRVSDIPEYERKHCESCRSMELCYSNDKLDCTIIDGALRQIGLTRVGEVENRQFKSYSIAVAEPSGLGDEAFISEVVGAKIKLSGTRLGTDDYRCSATREVMERWQRHSFFPFHDVLRLTEPFLSSCVYVTK